MLTNNNTIICGFCKRTHRVENATLPAGWCMRLGEFYCSECSRRLPTRLIDSCGICGARPLKDGDLSGAEIAGEPVCVSCFDDLRPYTKSVELTGMSAGQKPAITITFEVPRPDEA